MPTQNNIYRCKWVPLDNPLYVEYHDIEWGVPVYDDRRIFEFLILEGFQAGLSWLTILKKRENFRKAFYDFDPAKVAAMTEDDVAVLLNNAGIIRNKLKINAAVTNARCFLEIQTEFGSFCKYIWGFVNEKVLDNKIKALEQLPASTADSDRLSKDLKKRGMKFVGTTIIYAHMQAAGMVNDHEVNCFRYKEIKKQESSC